MKNKIVIGYATNRSKAFQKEFNEQLLASIGLSQEKGEVAIMSYDNDGSLSLTETYNTIWERAKIFENAVFVFLHHDIYFKSKDWGKELLDLFNMNEIDIVGIVGTDTLYEHCAWFLDHDVQFSSLNLWGNAWHIINGEETFTDYSRFSKPDAKCKKLQPVVAIDGVFIAFNPDTCLTFDEDFDGFHYYDVSFCVKNYLQGKHIAVTEAIQLCHESEGNFNDMWEQSRIKFFKKYGSYLPISI